MDTPLKPQPTPRPRIEDFDEPVQFVEAMLAFRKKSERGFSILRATSELRRVSPALVSLVIARKRALTADRADEFAKLLALTSAERHYFKTWLGTHADLRASAHSGARAGALANSSTGVATSAASPAPLKSHERKNRRDVSTHILKDWLNVYVKDLFRFANVQKNPDLAEKMLLHIATPKRVRASVEFLLREGHLRRTLDGRVVLETALAVADPKIPSAKIRAFHKAALGNAQKAFDRVDSSERMAQTLIIALNEKRYVELVSLIEEFSEKLKDFASVQPDDGKALYQLIVNLSPAGGKLK